MGLNSCLKQVKDTTERKTIEGQLRKYGYSSISKSNKTLISNIEQLLMLLDAYNSGLDDHILIDDPNTDKEFREHYENLCNAIEFFNGNRQVRLVKEFNPASHYITGGMKNDKN